MSRYTMTYLPSTYSWQLSELFFRHTTPHHTNRKRSSWRSEVYSYYLVYDQVNIYVQPSLQKSLHRVQVYFQEKTLILLDGVLR